MIEVDDLRDATPEERAMVGQFLSLLDQWRVEAQGKTSSQLAQTITAYLTVLEESPLEDHSVAAAYMALCREELMQRSGLQPVPFPE